MFLFVAQKNSKSKQINKCPQLYFSCVLISAVSNRDFSMLADSNKCSYLYLQLSALRNAPDKAALEKKAN